MTSQTPEETHNTIDEIVKDMQEKLDLDCWSPECACSGSKKVEAWLRTTLHHQLQKAREDAQAEYKQFVLNVLDGVDIADGQCNTKAIRFALESRIIHSELDQPTV